MENGPYLIGDARQNKLLAALPRVDWRRVQPHLELMDLSLGEILCESDSRLTHAYFPTTSIISVMCVTTDGASTEIAATGNEGLVGISLFMGGTATSNRVVVQSKGRAFRLRRDILTSEFRRGDAMQHLLLRYTQVQLTLIAQMAVCNRRHSIDQQLCRWLLLTLDRLASEELTMTHELLANTLGVRREGITEAAHKLQSAGLIQYSRGHITVVDRAGLEACCCECYGVVRRALVRRPAMIAYSPRGVRLDATFGAEPRWRPTAVVPVPSRPFDAGRKPR